MIVEGMKYCIQEYNPAYNDRVSLYLDPGDDDSEPEVYTFGCIGSGIPGEVFHNRHISIGHVPRECVAEELKTWLQAHEELLLEIAGHYEGTEWNGSNWIGQWSGRGSCYDGPLDELRDKLELKLHDAYTYNELPTYWAPGDWYTNAMPDAVRLATSGRDLEEVAEEEAATAMRDGAWLDVDALAQFLEEVRRQQLG